MWEMFSLALKRGLNSFNSAFESSFSHNHTSHGHVDVKQWFCNTCYKGLIYDASWHLWKLNKQTKIQLATAALKAQMHCKIHK